jgi:hypothetical protein
VSSEEIGATAWSTDVECSRGNEKDNNEEIADDSRASDSIKLWRNRRVEWITGIENGGDVDIIGRRACTERLKDGVFGECHSV